MTLWEVSDKSGAQLMEDFYNVLKKGASKSEALRKAKIDFINEADMLKAHPYFWASYVAIGDTSPIFGNETKKRTLAILIAAGILLAAGSITVYLLWRKHKNHKNKTQARPDKIYT